MMNANPDILESMGPAGRSHIDESLDRTSDVRSDLGFNQEQIDELFEQDIYPYRRKLKRSAYEGRLRELQIELLKLLRWIRETERKMIIVFEGRDAAGKGGTIKRFTAHLNPRYARVEALDKPTEKERGQWYFHRYMERFPTDGEIVFFDRSWYNRAGVEPVMGFCTDEDHGLFLKQVPRFEKLISETDIILFKLWFAVSKRIQKERFEARENDPLKSWKLSPIDHASRNLWDEYTGARQTNFAASHTDHAPWTIIKSDDKKRARINAILHVLHEVDYPDKDHGVVRGPDPLIVGSPSQSLSQA